MRCSPSVLRATLRLQVISYARVVVNRTGRQPWNPRRVHQKASQTTALYAERTCELIRLVLPGMHRAHTVDICSGFEMWKSPALGQPRATPGTVQKANELMVREDYHYAAELLLACVRADRSNFSYVQSFLESLKKRYGNDVRGIAHSGSRGSKRGRQ